MKTLLATAIILTVGMVPSADAQTTQITPNGTGGYKIYTPPSIGPGSYDPGSTTTVTPNGAGGYNSYTPPSIGPNGSYDPGGSARITPNGMGGYNVYTQPRIWGF
jgi:hypothetical protein